MKNKIRNESHKGDDFVLGVIPYFQKFYNDFV